MPHFDALAAARALGVDDLVTFAGYVETGALPAYLAASDVVLSLRWPSARETSASWLRAIAAGRPTLVTDLAQQADVPMLDPRSWTVVHAQATLDRLEPVAVSIDILDEQHSLTVALKRLTTDPALRVAAGRGGTRTLDGRTHGRSHGGGLRRGPARGRGATAIRRCRCLRTCDRTPQPMPGTSSPRFQRRRYSGARR